MTVFSNIGASTTLYYAEKAREMLIAQVYREWRALPASSASSKIWNITRFAAIKNPVIAPPYLYHRSLMIDLYYVHCINDKDLQDIR